MPPSPNWSMEHLSEMMLSFLPRFDLFFRVYLNLVTVVATEEGRCVCCSQNILLKNVYKSCGKKFGNNWQTAVEVDSLTLESAFFFFDGAHFGNLRLLVF